MPLYIQVHTLDNVAIIVSPEGLPAGTQFPSGLTLKERIPQSHKVALQQIAAGDPIVRYGQIIGRATRAIDPGSWVREELLQLPQAPPLDELPLATATPAELPPLTGYTFEGFRNHDGRVGTKNIQASPPQSNA